MASLELVRIEKNFGDVRVVQGISLSIESGEFLVLVGPSGCGKSTCLRMIAGLEEISSGEILIDGRVVNELPPKDRDIGMVFQSYALYPHMSVRENLAFGLTLRKLPRVEIDQRVAEAARILELDGLLDRRPKQLSGGQRQRVAMGRAIVRRPRVFLFDEPLSNLDSALRVQMRAELAALHGRLGATMVYVTHDQVEAMTLATRIAVLEGGRLHQVGPALELYRRPANRFVAGFIGSPSMNFLPGQLASRNGRLGFEREGMRVEVAGLDGRGGAGSAVTLGVRPHALSLGEGAIAGEVVVVEPMGFETFVHVRLGEERVVARLDGARPLPRLGETVRLSVEPAGVHLFDPSGTAIHHPAEGEPYAKAIGA